MRMRGNAVRGSLTDEWNERSAKKIDYGLLTNDIMKRAFGLKVSEHKQVKGIKNENLRDHMTPLELVVAMVGKATATHIIQQKKFSRITKITPAQDGGAVAGRTRKDIEKQIGTKVVSKENFLPAKKKKKLIEQ